MNQNDEAPVEAPIETLARRPFRESAKLLAAIALCLASLALAGSVLWGMRDEWPVWSVSPPAPPTEVAINLDGETPLSRGLTVYEARCARCHGAQGRGDGPEMVSSKEQPRDLASSAWRSGADRESVRRVLTAGIPAHSGPGFSAALSAPELDAVVHFVLSLEVTALLTRSGFTPGTGRIAPPLQFNDTHGTRGSLEQFRGQVVLIVFWGNSCRPCLEEFPDLERLAARFDKKGFVVLPVCIHGSNAETARATAAQHAPGLPVYVDSDGSVRTNYYVPRLPQGRLVDREGRMLGRCFGALHWAGTEMDELLQVCLRVSSPVVP